MWKSHLQILLLNIILCSSTYAEIASNGFLDCEQLNPLNLNGIICRSASAARKILHNLSKTKQPIVIVRGLEIVPVKDATNDSALAMDTSVFGRFANYLRTHELNIKFSDLLAEESERYVATARDLEQNGVNAQEARKKDKGQSSILIMAVMFAKLFAIMGLGGIGALAMKALGVAMAALLMTGLVGLKSISQQGHETSSVQYVTADGGHHHKRRRRRSAAMTISKIPNNPLPLAYRGWQDIRQSG